MQPQTGQIPDKPKPTRPPGYTPLSIAALAFAALAFAVALFAPYGSEVIAGAALAAAVLIRARAVSLPQLPADAPLDVTFTEQERKQITALPGVTQDQP